MISFIGKVLIVEEDKEKVAVISDIHLGYEASLRAQGTFVPGYLFSETLQEIKNVFNSVGKVNKIVLLGDVKHVFGKIMPDEWKEVSKLIEVLRNYTKEVIVVKGNHDVILNPILEKEKIELVDFYLWKDLVFLHGDKNFKEIYKKEIKYWVLGHAHPAVILTDGPKKEKYKCFLKGFYKNKEVIIMPSFFRVSEGSDVLNDDLKLVWNFNLKSFDVYLVESETSVLKFGTLSKIKGINLLS